ncbi:MAG: DUF3592 domain-containing protein [Pseudomonadales bacterium]
MFTEEKVVLMVFGLVWVGGVFLCRKFYAAREWPCVDGVVTKSALEWESGNADMSGGYTMDVEYEYVVNSRKYVRNGLRLGWKLMMGFKSSMEKRLAAFPVGKRVTVSYNPRKPKESYVVPANPDQLRLLLIVIAIVLVGFWIYYN